DAVPARPGHHQSPAGRSWARRAGTGLKRKREMAQQAWSVADIPDQTGKTVVVTGANSGLGFAAARALAAHGAHVVLAVRSAARGQAAESVILGATPRASLEVMVLDLANLVCVHRFAAGFLARFDALPLLVNNAGVG